MRVFVGSNENTISDAILILKNDLLASTSQAVEEISFRPMGDTKGEKIMTEVNPTTPMNDSTTVTIVGVSNFALPDSREMPTYGVTSYIVPDHDSAPSSPLSEGAVRVGNSLLSAYVPESAILRDHGGDS
jgi:hypothetical protein